MLTLRSAVIALAIVFGFSAALAVSTSGAAAKTDEVVKPAP